MPLLNTPDFLFQNAIDFFELGRKRTIEIFKKDPLKNTLLWYHISAPAVNLAFSLELMLKTILLIEKSVLDREDKQHQLKNLFLKISSDARNGIIGNLSLHEREEFRYPAFRFSKEDSNIPIKITSKAGQTAEEKIFELLSTHDNSFISWRYSFELSEIENKMEFIEFNFGDMIRLIYATYIYLKNILEKK